MELLFRTRRQSIIRCGKMTTIRRFCCDDLLKFANVNIDHLTETVISPLLLCCLIDWGSFSLLLHFWTRDALRYWKALPCVYLRKHECSGNIIHRLAEDGACCVCGYVSSVQHGVLSDLHGEMAGLLPSGGGAKRIHYGLQYANLIFHLLLCLFVNSVAYCTKAWPPII